MSHRLADHISRVDLVLGAGWRRCTRYRAQTGEGGAGPEMRVAEARRCVRPAARWCLLFEYASRGNREVDAIVPSLVLANSGV